MSSKPVTRFFLGDIRSLSAGQQAATSAPARPGSAALVDDALHDLGNILGGVDGLLE